LQSAAGAGPCGHYNLEGSRRSGRERDRPAREPALRYDRTGERDAHGERRGNRAGRHADGAAVPAGDNGGAVRARGYTFIELLVVTTIIMILASAIMPLARVTATRTREAELHRALREMRTAIDKVKDAADLQNIAP